jgi:hypothetical protein
MELDNIKYVWKRIQEQEGNGETTVQIQELLEKKSQHPITRMKSNLRIEFFLSVGLYLPLIGWYLFDFNGKLPEVAGFLLLIFLVFMAYYYRKHRLFNEMQNLSFPVKENLERQIITLEKYLRFYRRADLLIPLCLLFLAGLMYTKLPSPLGPSLFYTHPSHPLWKILLLWMGILVFSSGLIYFADRWFVNRWYTDHIRKLKGMLEEINE